MELQLLDFWTVPLCGKEVPKEQVVTLVLEWKSVCPSVSKSGSSRFGEEGSCVVGVSMRVSCGSGREVATGGLQEGCSLIRG